MVASMPLLLPLLLGATALPRPAVAVEGARPPRGETLRKLVEEVARATPDRREEIAAEADRTYAPLRARDLKKLRDEMLKAARRAGPRLKKSGTHYFYDEEEKRGKYIVEGKPGKALFIGLHGGGVGSGDARSMASAMGGGGYWWIFPEVLEKTEHGWTDSGTEEFVLELVEAAKRTADIDPDRIYVTGHSMGGYGTWMYAAHHPDVFAGGAAYAGAPTVIYASRTRSDALQNIAGVIEGVLPNLLNSRFFFYQSLDDENVPPGPNMYCNKALLEWKQRYPGGFDFRYLEVDGRGHAAPAEGYLETQRWVAEHVRVARPRRLLWQPVLAWKRQFHWLYWREPEKNALIEVFAAGDNTIEITTHEGSGSVAGLSLLLGEPLVDLDEPVVVRVDGEERFSGTVERTLSTLLLTIPRNDPQLLFDARIDL